MAKENKNATGNTLSGMGTGAATGAAIGSYVGPYGTAIGAGVGAIVGGVAGYFSGQKEATRNVKSLSVGPGNLMAGYSNDEVAKDYSYGDIIIGGETTSLAKAGQITNMTLQAAGALSNTMSANKGAKDVTGQAGITPELEANGSLAVKPNNPIQAPIIEQKPYVGQEIQVKDNGFWTQQYQGQNQSLYTNPYKK